MLRCWCYQQQIQHFSRKSLNVEINMRKSVSTSFSLPTMCLLVSVFTIGDIPTVNKLRKVYSGAAQYARRVGHACLDPLY
jgi:hypothetical protein